MKTSLGRFQEAFVEALYQRSPPGLQGLTEQAGFSVYRNTVLKGCTDALCDNFPSVERLVGTDWLRGAATIHAQQTPPNDARLVLYGEDFADFLDAFEPARELPYLAGVARLDRLWLEAYTAPQEPALQWSDLAGMTASDLAPCHLHPAPARAGAGSTNSRSTASGATTAKRCHCPKSCPGTLKARCWSAMPRASPGRHWTWAVAPSSMPAPAVMTSIRHRPWRSGRKPTSTSRYCWATCSAPPCSNR